MLLSAVVWPQFATQVFWAGTRSIRCYIRSYENKQVNKFTFYSTVHGTKCLNHHNQAAVDTVCKVVAGSPSDSWAIASCMLHFVSVGQSSWG